MHLFDTSHSRPFESHQSLTFEFSPSSASIHPLQSPEFTNLFSDSYDRHIRDWREQLEVHASYPITSSAASSLLQFANAAINSRNNRFDRDAFLRFLIRISPMLSLTMTSRSRMSIFSTTVPLPSELIR